MDQLHKPKSFRSRSKNLDSKLLSLGTGLLKKYKIMNTHFYLKWYFNEKVITTNYKFKEIDKHHKHSKMPDTISAGYIRYRRHMLIFLGLQKR